MSSSSSAAPGDGPAEAQQLRLWQGPNQIELEEPLDGALAKLVAVGPRLFLMTTACSLYYGDIVEAETSASVRLCKKDLSVLDIAANSEHLFAVTNDGAVQKINPIDLEVVDTVVLKEEDKYCSHGCKRENSVAKVNAIAVNDESALYVTDNGQLWASGDQPQVDVKSETPRRVVFFEGRYVTDIACGSDFHLVLARRLSRLTRDDTDSENEAEEVFAKSCASCLSSVAPSPMSRGSSSGTGPLLGRPQPRNLSLSGRSVSGLSSASREDVFGSFDNDPPTAAPLQNGEAHEEILSSQESFRSDSEYREPKKSQEGDNTTTSSRNNHASSNGGNSLLLNTEAARQFLTRQLSWVSSSYSSGAAAAAREEQLALEPLQQETAGSGSPAATSLLKQNVTSVASLVYEGVRSVGDRVVTLSRHVSGSSDANDSPAGRGGPPGDDDTFEELGIEESKRTAGALVSSLRATGWPAAPTSSAGSSERELRQLRRRRLDERARALVRLGETLLAGELWAWGDARHGQLGLGDLVARARACEVTSLGHCALARLAADPAGHHALALTLDGRAFAWGRNNYMQVAHCSQLDQKAPQLFSSNFFLQLAEGERARDLAAGRDHSLVMTDQRVFLVGKHGSSGVMSTLEMPGTKEEYTLRRVFCSGNLSCCTMTKGAASPASEALAEEKAFLEKSLQAYRSLITPFRVKSGASSQANTYESLCRCYKELLSVNVLNVKSLQDCCNGAIEAREVILLASAEEFLSVYRAYVYSLCDVIALGGFAQIAKLIDVLDTLGSVFKPEADAKSGDVSNEAVIAAALQQPLQHSTCYVDTMKRLIKSSKSDGKANDLQESLNKWESAFKEQTKRLQEAESTKTFWEGSGKLVEHFRSPERRMIRESRTNPISLQNSSRFSSHWFILLTDVLVHVSGTNYTAHLLPLLWVEMLADSDNLKNAISITTPEDNFVLYTPTAADRSEWFHAFQIAINKSLQRSASHKPPQIRTGSFTFTKHSIYKDAIYTGQWMNGKLHGSGKLEWADNRMYIGQFHKGAIHGAGRMEMPTQGVYEGQWKDGQQNGYGIMNYINGDVYEGYFKDGLPHSHGMKKEGHFMASVASVYVGEWSSGMKQGYGVMDDIKTGEKYMGFWNNNSKHGNGLIVTLDGIYYEGVFVQDVFTGRGIMVLEDGTHYEGEFKSVGVFGGKGILTFSNGEKSEGNFTGAWNEGIGITGKLYINNKTVENSKQGPPSFGKLSAPPDQKWKAIFRQFYQQLGIPDNQSNGNAKNSMPRQLDTQKLWQNVAAIISKSERSNQKRQYFNSNICLASSLSQKDGKDAETSYDQLNKILCSGYEKLSMPAYEQIHKYLSRAFESPHHPLGMLLSELATVYTATYGGVRVHPLLLKHAVKELRSMTSRIYEAVNLFFPALPKAEDQFILKAENGECNEEKVISAAAILHPILLPRVYSALFVLYALHNKKTDDAYWERLIKWNKQPNNTLLAFLGIDEKFWKNYDTADNDIFLNEAIETLQQLKTTFSAVEKLIVIRNTHHQIELAIQKRLKENYKLPADELIPIFYFVVIRASVLQLQSEIHFINDFMEPYLKNGPIGYAFTTLMGIYDHILQEKISMDD